MHIRHTIPTNPRRTALSRCGPRRPTRPYCFLRRGALHSWQRQLTRLVVVLVLVRVMGGFSFGSSVRSRHGTRFGPVLFVFGLHVVSVLTVGGFTPQVAVADDEEEDGKADPLYVSIIPQEMV